MAENSPQQIHYNEAVAILALSNTSCQLIMWYVVLTAAGVSGCQATSPATVRQSTSWTRSSGCRQDYWSPASTSWVWISLWSLRERERQSLVKKNKRALHGKTHITSLVWFWPLLRVSLLSNNAKTTILGWSGSLKRQQRTTMSLVWVWPLLHTILSLSPPLFSFISPPLTLSSRALTAQKKHWC